MVSIEINGQKIKMLSSKEELTFKQYTRLIEEVGYDKPVEERDWLAAFNILAGTSFKQIASLEEHMKLYTLIEWAIEGFQFELSKEDFKWHGEKIKMPKTSNLSIGQAITLKQSIAKYKYLESSAAAVLAIYLQPIIDNADYSLERAREIEKEIELMPAQIVWTYGFFLHKKLLTSGLFFTNNKSATQINLKTWLQLMRLNLQVMGSLAFFLILKLYRRMQKFILWIQIQYIQKATWILYLIS